MKKKLTRTIPAGMCPNMTKPQKKKTRKKPSPYKSPIHVKRYYKGLTDGIAILRDDLLEQIEDEELKSLIKLRASRMAAAQSKRLTDLENKKTKEKIAKWEEEEWMSL